MPSTSTLLDEFNALAAQSAARKLSEDEEQRLELLRDVLLELGALPAPGGKSARAPRIEAVLEVSFKTGDEVGRAYSKDIGSGGIAIKTSRVLPPGSSIELRIQLPDAGQPVVAEARVAWSRSGEMGVEFVRLAVPHEKRLKQYLLRDERLLDRVRSVLTKDVREIGKIDAPTAVAAAEVDTRLPVLVQLSDAREQKVVTEVLRQAGLRVLAAGSGVRPAVVVAEPATAAEVVAAARTPLILMNASGPDALAGRSAQLNPDAYIRRRAPVVEVLEAVKRLMPDR